MERSDNDYAAPSAAPLLMHEIRCLVRDQGGNVTHLLHVDVSGARTREEGDRIRRQVHARLANVPHVLDLPAVTGATITWRSTSLADGVHVPTYHCDVALLGDAAVREHTKRLLQIVMRDLDAEFDRAFSLGHAGIAFLVTKPLSRGEALLVDDVAL